MTDQPPLDPGRAVAGMQAVEAHYTDGDLFGTGRVIAYYAMPTYVIERPDGTRFSWRADMTFARPTGTI